MAEVDGGKIVAWFYQRRGDPGPVPQGWVLARPSVVVYLCVCLCYGGSPGFAGRLAQLHAGGKLWKSVCLRVCWAMH